MATQKYPGAWLAVGSWVRNPHCVVTQDQSPQKIKVLLEDKLITLGRPVDLWLPVSDSTPGIVPCTCDKNTRPGSDYRCLSCYGVRSIPGYLKFMHQMIFAASAEYQSFTLVNIERDTTIKPNRLRLTSAALTGTIVTQPKAFTNPQNTDWEFQVAAFRKTNTDTVTAEFSVDGGVTYNLIENINTVRPGAAGNIQFRITLTRAALTTDSPDFEILRIRRGMPENLADGPKSRDLLPGQILILRTWIVEQVVRQVGLGRQVEWQGDKAWTADLAFFDKTIPTDTTAGLITDREAGPHPFMQHVSGIRTGDRFALYQISFNDNFDEVLTYQSFADRKAQTGEVYSLVF